MKSATATLTIPGREPVSVDVRDRESSASIALRLVAALETPNAPFIEVACTAYNRARLGPDIVKVFPGLKLLSEANMRHNRWLKATRAKNQKSHGMLAFCNEFKRKPPKPGETFVIRISRIGPRKLDSDNLAGSAKALRDGIAAAMGIDDGSPRIEWTYAQRKGRPKEYAVEVEIWRRG